MVLIIRTMTIHFVQQSLLPEYYPTKQKSKKTKSFTLQKLLIYTFFQHFIVDITIIKLDGSHTRCMCNVMTV